MGMVNSWREICTKVICHPYFSGLSAGLSPSNRKSAFHSFTHSSVATEKSPPQADYGAQWEAMSDEQTSGQLRNNRGTVLVDPQDSWLLHFPWFEHKGTNTSYARTKINRDGWHTFIFLHRAIMQPAPHEVVDHKNGNGLDNRRSNLRVCTKGQNSCNRRGGCKTSRFKGVSWNSKDKCWRMQVGARGERIIEYYGKNREEDAARSYDQHAKRLFGDFAFLNFP